MKKLLLRAFRRVSESAAIASFGVSYAEKARIFFTLLVRNNAQVFPLTFHFSHNRVQFMLTFRSHADLMLFHEIFAGHPYKLETESSPEYVIDLGANIGISTLYLYTRYPHAKIAAVEANPLLLPRLKETVGMFSNINVLPFAAGRENGLVYFYVDEEQPLGSSLTARNENARQISVEARSLASIQEIVDFPRIDFIKFDIEGAEYEVFAPYQRRTEIRAIVGEVHEDLMEVTVKEFEKLWEGMHLHLVPTKKKQRSNIYGVR